MRQIAKKTLMVLSLVLFTSGCGKQEACVPIVQMVKPERVNIERAKIEQCLYADYRDNIKCLMKNYVKVKAERDKLRDAYEYVTK